MSKELQIPIPKAGKGAVLLVDVDTIVDNETFALVVQEGLKSILNSRMSKITGVAKMEASEAAKAQAEAMEIAKDNLSRLLNGEYKNKATAKAKSTGPALPKAVLTEARRLARELVKNELRKAKITISHVKASEITKAADAMIAKDESIVARAKANLESRADLSGAIDISSILPKEDPRLVEKAKRDRAERGTQLSATQSGKVAPRKKPTEVHVGAIH